MPLKEKNIKHFLSHGEKPVVPSAFLAEIYKRMKYSAGDGSIISRDIFHDANFFCHFTFQMQYSPFHECTPFWLSSPPLS